MELPRQQERLICNSDGVRQGYQLEFETRVPHLCITGQAILPHHSNGVEKDEAPSDMD